MSTGIAIFKGIEGILKLIFPILKTAQDKNLIEAQTQKTRSEADKIEAERISGLSKTFSDSIKSFAESKSLEMETLNKAIGLYQSMGYTQEEIRERIGPQMEKLLETYEDIKILNDLVNRGKILKIAVRESIELEDKL